jgi:hypothetical protein
VLCRPDKLGWSNLSNNCSVQEEAENRALFEVGSGRGKEDRYL